MSRIILSVENVAKRYVTYNSTTARILSWFNVPLKPTSEFWAVRDVSFQVNAGEALAIIGSNGAGKSTLLKMVTGTVRPFSGNIVINGRVSAMLELGLGFNPEFTGRQNIYMSCGLMGMSVAEIDRLMADIIAFAEIGDFLEQPLRTFSSGMQARLAFAVATAVRPDILIVDEVLSVGDSYFQHKSFDRIRQFKEDGCAIIFVSHGMSDVRALCDRVILLEKGTVLKDGLPDEVVDFYNALIAEKENAKATIQQDRKDNGWLLTKSGTREISAESVNLVDAATGTDVATAIVGQDLRLRIVASANAAVPRFVIGLMLRDRAGNIVWGTNTFHTRQVEHAVKPGEVITLDWNFRCGLGPGSYGLSYALTADDTHTHANYEWVDNSIVFDVINVNLPIFIGTNHLDGSIKVARRAGHG